MNEHDDNIISRRAEDLMTKIGNFFLLMVNNIDDNPSLTLGMMSVAFIRMAMRHPEWGMGIVQISKIEEAWGVKAYNAEQTMLKEFAIDRWIVTDNTDK